MKLAVSRIHISPGRFNLAPLIANTIDIEGQDLLMGLRFQNERQNILILALPLAEPKISCDN